MSEPQTWTLPEEPPVGTVVGPVDEKDKRRWSRHHATLNGAVTYWLYSHGPQGDLLLGTSKFKWSDLIRIGVREYSDPTDPDGYQQELDKLRAEVESLRADLLATAQNLTQAERDRDVNGEALSRAQRERGEAQREAAALKSALQSISQAASRAVLPS